MFLPPFQPLALPSNFNEFVPMCNRIGGCSDVETSTTNWILKQSVRDRARTVPRRRRNGDDPRLRFTRGDRPWLRAAKFCVKREIVHLPDNLIR